MGGSAHEWKGTLRAPARAGSTAVAHLVFSSIHDARVGASLQAG